ncbi:MAG: hypothetical protein Q8Q14_16010 [Gemmatimonadales bacterium]|nr:hypothetical protein [Gemmatimonadales bacterium]
MSLQNLLKIGQLKEHPPNPAEIQQLLAAAQRNLGDARARGITPETRFDAAYKAIMQAALAAMMAHGYRPDTSRPGHHMTVVQALSLTIGLPAARITVLDTLRRKRNISDYTGLGTAIPEPTQFPAVIPGLAWFYDLSGVPRQSRPGELPAAEVRGTGWLKVVAA